MLAPFRVERVESGRSAFAFNVISKTCRGHQEATPPPPALMCPHPSAGNHPRDWHLPLCSEQLTGCESFFTAKGMEAVEFSGNWECPREFILGVLLRRKWPLPICVSSILKPERVWRDF